MTIKEVCKKFDITPDTLRYYERVGVIPEVNRTKGGMNARPELVSLLDSIDQYDTVILAYPNYWGTMPMAVFTFLEAFDFSGKTILPLCTNEASGMGSRESDIKKLCPTSEVKIGLQLNGSGVNRADAQIESWLKSNGLM